MGGKSRSSNKTNTTTTTTTTNTNVSGTAATSGDNNGLMLSGVNDSHINVNMTDHGAMERAAELGELALNSNADVSKAAIKANSEVSNSAMKQVSNAHGENLQMLAGLAGNQAAQNAENLATIKELAAMKTDGGQVATSKQMVVLVGMILLFMTMMAYAGGKK